MGTRSTRSCVKSRSNSTQKICFTACKISRRDKPRGVEMLPQASVGQPEWDRGAENVRLDDGLRGGTNVEDCSRLVRRLRSPGHIGKCAVYAARSDRVRERDDADPGLSHRKEGHARYASGLPTAPEVQRAKSGRRTFPWCGRCRWRRSTGA